MTNALDLALANAAANAPKGEELHLENLDSIADPAQDEFVAFDTELRKAALNRPSPDHYRKAQPNPDPEYQKQKMAELMAYTPVSIEAEMLACIKSMLGKTDLTNLRLDALADMITEVSTTISKAAQSMPQEPDLKHRSLEEWPLTTLINELVERENGFMPFWYELRKRIPHELQQYVGDAMKGKYQSLEVLSELCAAMSYAQQPKPTITEPLHEEQYYPVEKQPFANKMVDPYPKAVPPQGKVTYPFNPYTS